jgi:hypothetical protein
MEFHLHHTSIFQKVPHAVKCVAVSLNSTFVRGKKQIQKYVQFVQCFFTKLNLKINNRSQQKRNVRTYSASSIDQAQKTKWGPKWKYKMGKVVVTNKIK